MSEEKERNECGTFGDNYFDAGEDPEDNKYLEMWKEVYITTPEELAGKWTVDEFNKQFLRTGWLPGLSEKDLEELAEAEWTAEHIKDICDACAESEKAGKTKIKDITKDLSCQLKGAKSGLFAKPFIIFMGSLAELESNRPAHAMPKNYGFQDSS